MTSSAVTPDNTSRRASAIDDQQNQSTSGSSRSSGSEKTTNADENFQLGPSNYVLVSTLCFLAAFGGFMFGFDTGTISGMINMTEFLRHFGQKVSGTYALSKVRSGLIVSGVPIGAGFGSVFLSKLGDTYGRKMGITVSCIFYVVGTLIQITSFWAWYQIFIGRVVSGLGIGTLSVLVPMFQSESAPRQVRGTLVSSFQLFVTLGIFLGYVVDYKTSVRNDTGAYRIPMGICFGWAILLITSVTFMPESPRWLVANGQMDKARQSIAFSVRLSPDHPYVKNEMDHITAALAKERQAGVASWANLITGKPKIGYRLMIATMIMSLNQLVGANYFFYYGTSIFKAIGMQNSFATSIIFGAVNLFSTCCGLYIISKFNRRTVLLYGYTSMFVFFVIYAALGVKALYADNNQSAARKGVGEGMIAVTCFYIFCFATSTGPLSYVITSEIFPTNIRSKGVGVATAVTWIWNFLITFFTPFITEAIGFNYGWVFSACCAFGIFFEYFCVPETKNLSLEDIDEMFALNVKPWKSSAWVASRQHQSSPPVEPKAGSTPRHDDNAHQV